MVSIGVIYVKFSIQRCLNYLSSMHSLPAAVKGSWLFLNRFLCSNVNFARSTMYNTVHIHVHLYSTVHVHVYMYVRTYTCILSILLDVIQT